MVPWRRALTSRIEVRDIRIRPVDDVLEISAIIANRSPPEVAVVSASVRLPLRIGGVDILIPLWSGSGFVSSSVVHVPETGQVAFAI